MEAILRIFPIICSGASAALALVLAHASVLSPFGLPVAFGIMLLLGVGGLSYCCFRISGSRWWLALVVPGAVIVVVGAWAAMRAFTVDLFLLSLHAQHFIQSAIAVGCILSLVMWGGGALVQPSLVRAR